VRRSDDNGCSYERQQRKQRVQAEQATCKY
jgi:hypothetical protein